MQAKTLASLDSARSPQLDGDRNANSLTWRPIRGTAGRRHRYVLPAFRTDLHTGRPIKPFPIIISNL